MFKVLTSLASGEEPTEEDMRLMDDLLRELDDFAEAVKQGRA
jgi:hypothetical protein